MPAPKGGPKRSPAKVKRERQQLQLLQALAHFHRVREACEYCDIKYSTYTYWRKTDPRFAARADDIKAEARLEDGAAHWSSAFPGIDEDTGDIPLDLFFNEEDEGRAYDWFADQPFAVRRRSPLDGDKGEYRLSDPF